MDLEVLRQRGDWLCNGGVFKGVSPLRFDAKLYIKLSIKLLGNTKGLRSKALHQPLCREALHEAVRKVPRWGGSMESL